MALVLNNSDRVPLSIASSHKTVPAPFLTKTYQLVNDSTTDQIVSWGEDDNSFVVWRPTEFARDLLPNYFKHNNFSSFVRQLNTYGFRKIVPDRWEFANDFFRKGENHLLCEIHRRKTVQPQTAMSQQNSHSSSLPGVHHFNGQAGASSPFASRVSISTSDSDSESPLSSPVGVSSVMSGSPGFSLSVTSNGVGFDGATGGFCMGSFITALSEDNERLRRSNQMLMTELARMKKLYNDIILFLQNHVQPVSSSSLCSTSIPSSGYPISTKPFLPSPPNQIPCYYPSPKFAKNGDGIPETQESCLSNSRINKQMHPSSDCKTKLFGVSLLSKKRLHPNGSQLPFSSSQSPVTVEESEFSVFRRKDELGLNLMPPSAC